MSTTRMKSKTIATWLALGGGALGAHRFYLYGWRDALAWMHWPIAIAGLLGLARAHSLGQDDRVAWALLPLLGLMLTQGMLCGIVYGLRPNDRWDAQHNPGRTSPSTHWGTVAGVILCLMLGAGFLMSTLAFCAQRYFELQAS
ncbi:NINE protein [Roseateles sp. BYS180W]|uniref:NINE protein n=1 Tax=Roseateles rivi TaxID=3299028 RepID=A0ABW7FZK4_9BURK